MFCGQTTTKKPHTVIWWRWYSSRRTSGRDKYGQPVHTEFWLIVENLSSRCSWQDLKDFMRQAGEVIYADAPHKERTNEGVIEFRSYSDMKHALNKLDGTEINAEILGSLKINHEQAIGGLTLEADQGHDVEESSQSRSCRSSCSRS